MGGGGSQERKDEVIKGWDVGGSVTVKKDPPTVSVGEDGGQGLGGNDEGGRESAAYNEDMGNW